MNLVTGVAVYKTPGRRIDQQFGDVMRSGILISGDEGYCITRIASTGLRAPEPEDAAVYSERILFIGDSYTQAIQVMDSDTYVGRVESALRANGRDAVCINAGMPGGTPAGYLNNAAGLVEIYAPTRVFIQVNDTDFDSNLTTPRTRGFWIERTGSTWTVKSAPIPEATQRLRDVVSDIPVVYWLLKRYWAGDGQIGEAQEETADSDEVDPELIDSVLTALREAYGSEVVVIYAAQIDHFDGDNEPTPMESAIEASCGRLGIDFVDVRQMLLDEYTATRQPLNGFANTIPGLGHYNSRGHAVIADALTSCLMSDYGPQEADSGK
jgi:hypothetical protein